MQKLAEEQFEKIEAVNRDRKFHQVFRVLARYWFCNLSACCILFYKFLIFFGFLFGFSLNFQQTTAFELNALSAQWKELCQKNIDIQDACAKLENHISELKREAAER